MDEQLSSSEVVVVVWISNKTTEVTVVVELMCV